MGINSKTTKEGLEFSHEQYQIISEYCKIKEIEWLASVWDLKSVKFLENFKLNYNKIASPMIVSRFVGKSFITKNTLSQLECVIFKI